nr:head decoration protein [Proteus mirabilis]
MKNTNVDMLAGSRDLNAWEPTQIFAGESPIHTDNGEASSDIDMYQVVYRKEDGTIAAFDDTVYPGTGSGGDEGEGTATAILPVGISAQATKSGQTVQFYTGGTFNIDAITWPKAIDDLVKAKSLFELGRSTIIIKKLY